MMNKFATVINCMDGRVQLPVIDYLKKRYCVQYIDVVTEKGPNLILAEHTDKTIVDSILDRVNISVGLHNSVGLAVVGHHDCGGNPAPKEEQVLQLIKSINFLGEYYKNIKIIALWVDENWEVHEIPAKF